MVCIVDCTGFEPVTSALSRQRSKPTELTVLNQKSFSKEKLCGREGIRTPDPLGVNQVL